MTSHLPPAVVRHLPANDTEAAIVTDAAGLIVFANGAAESLFGYAAGELGGQPIEVLMPSAHRERHRQYRETYSRMPRSRPLMSGLDLVGRRKDGSRFRAEIALTPVRTPEGLLVASTIREANHDADSDSYFRTMLEAAPDAIIIVDGDGRIAVVNQQAENMFGYDRTELLGESVDMLLPEKLRERHATHRQTFAAKPELRPMGADFELIGRRRDGSEFPVEISLSPVRSSGDRFVCSVIRDVTERKRMERELIEAQRAAERATRANNAFLAAASHDLRQPVQALNLLNGALRRTVRDEKALAMIRSQEASLQAMTNLLNSLLDISRLDAGAVVPQIEEFPLQRLLDRLSAEFRRQARQKQLAFVAEPCALTVRSDPNLLSEIIQNLVSNAIRYTSRGSVRLRCIVTGADCRLDVVDTGIGIAADELEAIFREFHQAKRSGGKKEGFGLGLAIVKRLADLLGHEIAVESTPGAGSRFSLSLPVVAGAGAAPDERRRDPAVDSAAHGLVLLVEDDPAVADAWRMLLDAEGYRVTMAESAGQVQDLLPGLECRPSLVITDYHLLDDSTGVEVITAVRGYYGATLPAFIITGDTSHVVDDAETLENCLVLSKPVDATDLLTAAGRAAATGLVPQR